MACSAKGYSMTLLDRTHRFACLSITDAMRRRAYKLLGQGHLVTTGRTAGHTKAWDRTMRECSLLVMPRCELHPSVDHCRPISLKIIITGLAG